MLYLLRHGEAQSDGPDSQRALTPRGAANVERLAAFAARANLRVAEVRHSRKVRAQQTAEIFAKQLNCAATAIDGIAPNDDPEAFVEAIDRDDLLIVSHLPFLPLITAALLGNPRPLIDFHPATLAALVPFEDRWVIDFVVHPGIL